MFRKGFIMLVVGLVLIFISLQYRPRYYETPEVTNEIAIEAESSATTQKDAIVQPQSKKARPINPASLRQKAKEEAAKIQREKRAGLRMLDGRLANFSEMGEPLRSDFIWGEENIETGFRQDQDEWFLNAIQNYRDLLSKIDDKAMLSPVRWQTLAEKLIICQERLGKQANVEYNIQLCLEGLYFTQPTLANRVRLLSFYKKHFGNTAAQMLKEFENNAADQISKTFKDNAIENNIETVEEYQREEL